MTGLDCAVEPLAPSPEGEALARRTEAMLRRVHDENLERLQDLETWCRTIADRLAELSYAEQRQTLVTLGVQATVYCADHEPQYEVTVSIPLESIASNNMPKVANLVVDA